MKGKLLLIAIMAIVIVSRAYNVNRYPPLLWDEAAIGYNAYSILKTGKDEHGTFLPQVFKSFGDYKPGLYIYLTVPSVFIFGLNEFSTRFPSLIFGILICIFLYKITGTKHLLFLAATSPVLIHYSRGAWETNLATLLLLMSYYFYTKNKLYSTSVLLGLALYSYHSTKLYVILFALYYLFDSGYKFKKLLLPLAFFLIPIFYGFFIESESNRLKVVSILSFTRPTEEKEKIKESGELSYTIFNSQPIFIIRNVLGRYFNNLTPSYLFFSGETQNPRHSTPYIGLLLYPCILFLVLGIFKNNFSTKNDRFMLFWLLIAPIASAVTRDQVHTTRTMSFAIPLLYFSSVGYQSIKNKYLFLFSTIALILSFIYYLDLYHNHMLKKSPADLLSGYKESVQKSMSKKYENIFFTDYYGQPYIYYLFYSKYEPASYQSKSKFTEVGIDIGKIETLDNYSFKSFNYNWFLEQKNSLLILSHEEARRQNIYNNEKNIFIYYEN